MRFVDRSNDRELPPDYAGDILVWDIDKTYLDTRFSSIRGLAGIPFELAVDKRAVPGTVPLLRGLRHGPGEESALVPLHFISGSPKQLRAIVEKKMTIDGVQYDGIAFKDQFGLLKALRPKAITEQVGYKLACLLALYAEVPHGTKFLLFGDDVEKDVEAFTLFGQVCAGLRGRALRETLAKMHVAKPEQDAVIGLSSSLAMGRDPVERIFLHEVRGRAPSVHDPRVVRSKSFLHHAVVLFAMGRVRRACVEAVRADVMARGVSRQDAATFVQDAVSRFSLPKQVGDTLASPGPERAARIDEPQAGSG
jgi:hypothetical protein